MQSDDLTSAIFLVRGQRVMLDEDLAMVYGVETRVLNQAVKRNSSRFPVDFMFKLTWEEFDSLKAQMEAAKPLRSQIVTLKPRRGQHRKYLPSVFTEHGAVMLASVLNSSQAVDASIFVVRAFVKLREFLAGQNEISERVDHLEAKIKDLEERHDEKFHHVFEAIRQLIRPENEPRRPVGFRRKNEETE